MIDRIITQRIIRLRTWTAALPAAASPPPVRSTGGKDELDELARSIEEMVLSRDQAAQALGQSEERYRAIVEGQNELVCRWTPDGLITFANTAMCRYLGQERES